MKVRIHIERLILDGLPIDRHQAALIQQAVEAELARLLQGEAGGPTLRQGGSVYRLSGGEIQLSEPADPAGIGTQIGQALHRSVTT